MAMSIRMAKGKEPMVLVRGYEDVGVGAELDEAVMRRGYRRTTSLG
jgi:hypothetical protein